MHPEVQEVQEIQGRRTRRVIQGNPRVRGVQVGPVILVPLEGRWLQRVREIRGYPINLAHREVRRLLGLQFFQEDQRNQRFLEILVAPPIQENLHETIKMALALKPLFCVPLSFIALATYQLRPAVLGNLCFQQVQRAPVHLAILLRQLDLGIQQVLEMECVPFVVCLVCDQQRCSGFTSLQFARFVTKVDCVHVRTRKSNCSSVARRSLWSRTSRRARESLRSSWSRETYRSRGSRST